MKNKLTPIHVFLGFSLFFIIGYFFISKKEFVLKYPTTYESNTINEYHGIKIADPFDWLESESSTEVNEWINTQQNLTQSYFNNIPFKERIKSRLKNIWDYERQSIPFKKGNKYYYYHNNGLDQQSILMSKDCLNCTGSVVINPNHFSNDGSVSLAGTYFSKDFKYLGYAISRSGSDWKEFYIMDLDSKVILKDHLKWIKFSGMQWLDDGFFYNKYPEPQEGLEITSINQLSSIYYHKLGTEQSEDILFYEGHEEQTFTSINLTEDQKYMVLYKSKGTSGNSIAFQPTNKKVHKFQSIVNDYDSDQYIIDYVNGKFLMKTNRNAPMGKIVLVNPKLPNESNWETIIKEEQFPINSISIINKKLIIKYLEHSISKIYVHELNGKFLYNIDLPDLGSAWGFSGESMDSETFYMFTSFAYPPTIFHYDFNTKKSETIYHSNIAFDPSLYKTEQKFVTSKDGTKVPLFITHKKDLERNRKNPTLLSGYGGFNISITPSFKKSKIILLENNGVYASASLRGGGEYGEEWHRSGMLLNKQNVFDDFIACAEYLIGNWYTSSEKLAIMGGSNGGLLIGAVVNQRPDLFKVAFPRVGVMDMLKYEQFTIGWAWSTEYGSIKSAEHFNNLFSYSPLHNISSTINYPAMLVITADHDDRVVPAHSFKYISMLQNQCPNNLNPLLIKIEEKAGHGSGKSTDKIIETESEIWAFMFYNMDIHY